MRALLVLAGGVVLLVLVVLGVVLLLTCDRGPPDGEG
jgi:hypothetical protein